ncbi:hypothetical protein BDN72DRAFT_957174 [Pluteus cervinus]|uniref:Uncharacterized protein n=1 Tax=Pluteus cervinus TaxID=181527 RepID=A0ACD3B4W3_9AGAR|nr:hypothetical protein BDN72DRAFT_957174 [Pluteus cervinus]
MSSDPTPNLTLVAKFFVMPQVIDLSQEILDEIVGHLHDDNETLKTLSIISSKFLPICRALLFYLLRLNGDNCIRWDAHLRDCPSLRRAIKEIEIHPGGFQDTDEQYVVGVLDSIIGPTTITLRDPLGSPAITWTKLLPWLQQTITRTLSQPTVQTVTIARFKDISLSLLSGMGNCRKLLLVSCSFTQLAVPTSNPERSLHSRQKSSVGTLILTGSNMFNLLHEKPFYEFVDHPEFPLEVTSLSRLQIELYPDNAKKVEHLLSKCAQSLHYLGLLFRGGSTSVQHLSALRVLELNLDVIYYGMDPPRIHSALSGFLRSLESLYTGAGESENRLEEVYIPAFLGPTSFQEIPQDFWENLDSILVKLSPTRVRVVVTCWVKLRGRMPDLRTFLPNLTKSGRLSLTNDYWGERHNARTRPV